MSMRTAIIGMGVTGLSCLRYLAGKHDLVVLDTRDEPPNGAAARAGHPEVECHFGASACEVSLAGIGRVIVSPGVALDHPLVRRARAAGAAVVSDIDLFCEAARAPIYAVTGTNGKSTVTALAGHLLAALGRHPAVGGNLGEPALDLLADDRDCYVLELSSFQLERLSRHRFEAAAMLNVSEDHIDRHGSLEGYAASKRRIFTDVGRAVCNRQDPLTRPDGPVGELVTFGIDPPHDGHWGLAERDGATTLMWGEVPVVTLDALPLAGLHNALNVLAAFALTAEPQTAAGALAGAVAGFEGLPHRCQTVANVAGVRFIDDSKATNVGAVLAALEGLGARSGDSPRLILIAGGDGKGADFSPLRDPVRRFVKAVVLIGRDAPVLEGVLAGCVPVTRAAGMEDAVRAAMAQAEHGDTVLLSPACASLDMYRNYAERGNAFRTAASSLT
jgi:UDP-N-acetylmuramoylalanine--D-glutamate ligase